MQDLINTTLGQYEILALLGEGGMAAVYRARQRSVKRDVAIKVIKMGLVDTDSTIRRFKQEAEIVASLNHPHIIKIFDYGEQDDKVYIVMDLLAGGSLSQRLRGEPLPLKDIVHYLDEIAPALDHAHQHGVIHRDLKPQNVLLNQDNHAYLSDFGIAKPVKTEDMTLTQTGGVMGTPAYMSPEQWQAQPIDSRADIYALGVMLFEMLTGRLPFSADNVFALMNHHLYEDPPSIRKLRPDIPPGIEAVVNKALEKDRNKRFQSAEELRTAFKKAIYDSIKRPSPAPTAQGGEKTVKINPPKKAPRLGLYALAAAGVVLAIVLGTAAASHLLGGSNTPTPTTTASRTVIAVVTSVTPTPSDTPTLTQTATPTPTITRTFTPSPTPTTILAITPTFTPEISPTTQVPQGNAPGTLATSFTIPGENSLNVTSIAISADGNSIAAASRQNMAIWLWNGKADQLLYTLNGHKADVFSVAFSPDGKYLVSGSMDKTAILWNVQTGQQVHTFMGHSGAISSVAFSPDGRSILTGSADKTAILWDVQTGQPTCTFTGQGDGVTSVAFSPDGKAILLGATDGVRLWSMPCSATQTQPTKTFGTLPARSIAFSGTGQYIAIGTLNRPFQAQVWAIQGNQPKCTFNYDNDIYSVAFSSDGLHLLVASGNHIDVRDISANSCPTSPAQTITADNGALSAIFAPDGKHILTGGWNGQVIVN